VNSEINKGTCFTVCLSTSETLYSSDDKADKVIWKTDYSSVIEELKKQKLKDLKTEEPSYEIETIDSDKATILFVDDNEELCENVTDYLSENYNVIVAPNGKIGYEMAKQNQPDVILSDIVMPEMDGFELCNKLKNDVVTSHIPVILLTARGDSDSQFKGLEIGADYFIPKPFDIKLLNLRIKNLIDSRDKLKKRFLSNQYSDAREITTNNKDTQFMNKLLEYVNEYMAEPDLNINFIADKMAMSRSTFFRKMKAITGTTGKDFIDLVRLKKAAQLLTESDLNISEIAYDIGHSNPQYFSKWFKGYYKMSPSEYSLKHRKETNLTSDIQ
jgi:YesN/AraC family two-component response regulator